MNKYLQLYIFLFLAFFSLNLLAQDEHIYGKVTDKNDTPMQGVHVKSRYTQEATLTDFNGNYRLPLNPGRINIIEFTYVGAETQIEEFYLRRGDVREVNVTFFDKDVELGTYTIIGAQYGRSPIPTVKLDPKDFESIPTVSGNIEDILPMLGGTVSNNELSSQYSVRGGNYDENLVYVNDFQVYRPFLVRAGQQEGLSFINPDLVQGLDFSAGGFEARYGDKLSSVLDVRYKKPKAGSSKGSAYASLLGVGAHLEGANTGGNLSFLAGVRHKTNRYLLNSLPVQGDYTPSFTDFQALVSYKFDEAWELQWLTNYANNRYELAPDSSRTSFGTFNEALQLRVFFEGQE
ncbi:MAG: carboxypeptidase-like regulatory domain-containing protein, partial [Chitinophagales bacterium]